MVCKHRPDRLAADRLHDAPPCRLLGDQPSRPAGISLRGRAAHHGHDRGDLHAVELLRRLRPRLVRERRLKPASNVPLAHTRDLTRVAARRLCRRTCRQPLIQQLQDPDPSPATSRHLVSAGLELSELGLVCVAQAEPAEPLRGGLHLLDRSPRKVTGNPRSVGAGRGTSRSPKSVTHPCHSRATSCVLPGPSAADAR